MPIFKMGLLHGLQLYLGKGLVQTVEKLGGRGVESLTLSLAFTLQKH